MLLEFSATKTVQPTALLTRPSQLLGLTLDGQVQQKGAQGLNLLTVDRNAIESMTTAEAIVLLAPFAAQQQLLFVALQLLLAQPLLQGRAEGKNGLDHPFAAALPQQPRPLPSK